MQASSFVPPDERLSSFTSLLNAPPSSSVHLALLDDNTLYGSIAYYLSGLEDEHVGPFTNVLANSGSFWAIPLVQASTSAGSADRAPLTPLTRATNLSRAVAQATTRRVELLLKSRLGSIGWGTRRRMYQWTKSIINACQLDISASAPQPVVPELQHWQGQPVPRLSILTGLLLGLNAVREQNKGKSRSRPGLDVRGCILKVEDEWIVAMSECLEIANSHWDPSAQLPSTSSELDAWEREFKKRDSNSGLPDWRDAEQRKKVWEVPIVLAATTLQYLPDKKLEILPAASTINIVSDAILGLYERHSILINLSSDVVQSEEGLSLSGDSTTVRRVRQLMSDPVYPWLGPLSRLLASALSQATMQSTPADLANLTLNSNSETSVTPPFFERVRALSSKMEHDWLASDLAGAEESKIAPGSRENTQQIWAVFKSFIFSLTMAFDTLIEALIDMCPSPTVLIPADSKRPSGIEGQWPPMPSSNLPPEYLVIVQLILRAYGHLYWIVGTFGAAGFTAYTRVFYSSLDILGRDAEQCVLLMERIEPSSPSDELEMNEARRSAVTYYFDVAEQLTASLPDEIIEARLLPSCRPYLDDPRFKTTFESAHSFVLSVFSSQKRVCKHLSPYYIDLILRSFPELLNEGQFKHAYTTIINTLSDKDDATAWWALSKLGDAIDQKRMRVNGIIEGPEPTKEIRSLGAERDKAVPPSDSEVLQTLELTYIAQLSNINLTLLRSTLSKVRSIINEAERSGNKAKRMVLCEHTFGALALLDASTREEGLRWWADHRAEFGV